MENFIRIEYQTKQLKYGKWLKIAGGKEGEMQMINQCLYQCATW